MILQALKNMYPKASEKVLRAVMTDLEKCRGKNMSTEELADWIGKLVTAHTIEETLRIVARQHHTARGQPDELKGDERTSRLHSKASRGLGEKLYR